MGLSCSDKKDKKEVVDYNKGALTIYSDESFSSVVEALADAYMIHYPETNIKVEKKKEDLALLDFLNGSVNVVALSKKLSNEEKQAYEDNIGSKFHQDRFAVDAVLFVVPKTSSRNSISIDEIRDFLNSESKELIFDGVNSSNLNTVASYFKTKPKNLKYSIISGNENVVQQLEKYPSKIGVISKNTISREYAPEAIELRSKVKILPVEVEGKLYKAEGDDWRYFRYPFTRELYFLNREKRFAIAGGFIRFSCMQIGQMVVTKEGVLPYNLFKREVQMKK